MPPFRTIRAAGYADGTRYTAARTTLRISTPRRQPAPHTDPAGRCLFRRPLPERPLAPRAPRRMVGRLVVPADVVPAFVPLAELQLAALADRAPGMRRRRDP